LNGAILLAAKKAKRRKEGHRDNHQQEANMLRTTILSLAILQCRTALADDWRSIRGQIIVEGKIPERKLLIAKDAEVKDKAVCAAEDHFAEDLIIDKDSHGLANVFTQWS